MMRTYAKLRSDIKCVNVLLRAKNICSRKMIKCSSRVRKSYRKSDIWLAFRASSLKMESCCLKYMTAYKQSTMPALFGTSATSTRC